MPSGMHQIVMDLPIETIWDFVKEMNNWAPLVPGYIRHEKLNDRQSTWEFKTEIGIMKKKVQLLVEITEWNEPTRVSFTLKGLKEKYNGSGYFEAESLSANKTRMTGFLDVSAFGAAASMVNSMLKNTIPKYTEEMALAISAQLKELKQV
ncbi:SRPBCC family protein [Bacillus xiapuensis]|uniref:SRPBCC family protein n=1 Tax=Bacillus xiapuensis TaxID=2014075 RepID=A0ABU6NAY6_9BACI|nr:SRPBCC family protein [Bacillus xiapuensis]